MKKRMIESIANTIIEVLNDILNRIKKRKLFKQREYLIRILEICMMMHHKNKLNPPYCGALLYIRAVELF